MENELFEKYLKSAVNKLSRKNCAIIDDQLFEDKAETDHDTNVDDSKQTSDTVTLQREALIKLLVIAAKLGEVDQLNKIADVLDSFPDRHVIVVDDLEDLEDREDLEDDDENESDDDQEDEGIDESKSFEDLVADESIE